MPSQIRWCVTELNQVGVNLPFEHEMDHRYVNPSISCSRQFLVVFGEPSELADPSQCAFHHTAAGQRLKLVVARASAHQLQQPATGAPCPRYQPSGIGCVTLDYLEPRESAQQFCQHQSGPVPVLGAGWATHHGQEQPRGIHYDVAPASRHPLARIIAPGASFSVSLTFWLSMMPRWEWFPVPRSPGQRGAAPPQPAPKDIGPPFSEVPPDPAPRRQVAGHHSQRYAAAQQATYRMSFTTSRRFTFRGWPLKESGGSRGSSKRHWASIESVGNALQSIP